MWDLCLWCWGLHVSSGPNLSYVVDEPVFNPISDVASWTNTEGACLQSCPWTMPPRMGLGAVYPFAAVESLCRLGSSSHLLDHWWEILPLVLSWAVVCCATLLPCCSFPALPACLPAFALHLPHCCRVSWRSPNPQLLPLSCWTCPVPCLCLLPHLATCSLDPWEKLGSPCLERQSELIIFSFISAKIWFI